MIASLFVAEALAKSWCAAPIVAHEWGVTVLRPDGGSVATPDLPSWFARSGVQPVAGGRVRDLPADSGVRTLPVVQFWVDGSAPVAVEVGFTTGNALAWFPPVDALHLGDPSTQLAWDALELAPGGIASHAAERPWVEALRAMPGAAWVRRGADADRFLFYEGATREKPAVAVSFEPDGRARVQNRGDWPVHDLAVVHGGRLATVGRLGPGESVTVALDRLPDAAWRARSRAAWTSGDLARPLPQSDECVMMRDPATPVAEAVGHAIFGPELDVLLSVWGDALFSSDDHLVYREDPAALDAVMPVRLYTDMRHHFAWSRLGLVLVPGGG